MEQSRKGICTNFENCKNADSKLEIDIAVSADFVCPECGRDLTLITRGARTPTKKLLLFLIPIILVGGVLFYFTKVRSNISEDKPLDTKVDTAVSTNTSPISNVITSTTNEKPETQAVEDHTADNKPKMSSNNNYRPPKKLLSVQEYFTKLGASTTESKASLKLELLSLFVSANVPVIKMNEGQPTNDGTIIGDYVESVSTHNKKVTVISREQSNGKISKINVSEK